MKQEAKIDTIELAVPNFGSLAQPAKLVVKWLARSAKVSWSIGIGPMHPLFIQFVEFLDPQRDWSEQLISRLGREGSKARSGIDIAQTDLGIIGTTCAEWIRDSLPAVFEEVTRSYHRKMIASRSEPVQQGPIEMGAGSD
jgi:hypothetical protein